MKLIIAGGRDYTFKPDDIEALDQLHSNVKVTEVVSGTQRGADKEGEMWAVNNNLPIKRFPPDWNTYGRMAGPMRNYQMAEYADAVALFPGGRGTQSMFNEAKRAGIKIYDLRGL